MYVTFFRERTYIEKIAISKTRVKKIYEGVV